MGPPLRALRVAADTGIDLSDADRQVAIATDLGGLRIEGGRVPLDRIVAVQAPLFRPISVGLGESRATHEVAQVRRSHCGTRG